MSEYDQAWLQVYLSLALWVIKVIIREETNQ